MTMTYYHNPPRALAPSDHGDALPRIGHSPKSVSPSGSDEGFAYMQSERGEGDYEDTSLTSQTLNADGTPKRPMNAFMIFARKRRPQLSAENQSMRTGEISKILSKEWNSMEPAEKQYFQDQAKFLKDSFNTKYPDYVYRRRPNNSRKKRKADGPNSRQEGSLEGGEEYGPGDDLREPSDGDDAEHGLPLSNTHLKAPGYPPYAQSSEGVYRTGAAVQDHRLGYPPLGHDRAPSSDAILRSSSRGASAQYPYNSAHSHHHHRQAEGPFSSEHQTPTGYLGNWESRVSAASASAGWYGHDRGNPAAAPAIAKPYTPGSSSTWSGDSNTLPPPNHSSSSNHNYPFPTLNSPFYPQKSAGGDHPARSTSDSHSNSYPATGEPTTQSSRYSDPRYNLRYDDSPAGHGTAGGSQTPTPYHRSSAASDQDPRYHHRTRAPPQHSPEANAATLPNPGSHHMSQSYGYWPNDRGSGH